MYRTPPSCRPRSRRRRRARSRGLGERWQHPPRSRHPTPSVPKTPGSSQQSGPRGFTMYEPVATKSPPSTMSTLLSLRCSSMRMKRCTGSTPSFVSGRAVAAISASRASSRPRSVVNQDSKLRVAPTRECQLRQEVPRVSVHRDRRPAVLLERRGFQIHTHQRGGLIDLEAVTQPEVEREASHDHGRQPL